MAWKIYAWGMLALALITFAGRMAIRLKRPMAVANYDLLEAVFNLVLIPGLLGFAYQRACFALMFWRIVVPLAWFAAFYSLFSPSHRKVAQKKGRAVAAMAALASLLLNLPGMIAVTLYAYARPAIWK